jgi:hypothetical protein
MYLDPRSNKFGFIPWVLDSAWGEDWIASKAEQEQASIWHPWVGGKRFVQRVMAVEEFRRVYRLDFEDFLSRLYVPERLHRRIDEICRRHSRSDRRSVRVSSGPESQRRC